MRTRTPRVRVPAQVRALIPARTLVQTRAPAAVPAQVRVPIAARARVLARPISRRKAKVRRVTALLPQAVPSRRLRVATRALPLPIRARGLPPRRVREIRQIATAARLRTATRPQMLRATLLQTVVLPRAVLQMPGEIPLTMPGRVTTPRRAVMLPATAPLQPMQALRGRVPRRCRARARSQMPARTTAIRARVTRKIRTRATKAQRAKAMPRRALIRLP